MKNFKKKNKKQPGFIHTLFIYMLLYNLYVIKELISMQIAFF